MEMIEIIQTLLIIRFDINDLNIPIKRDYQNGLKHTYAHTYMTKICTINKRYTKYQGLISLKVKNEK